MKRPVISTPLVELNPSHSVIINDRGGYLYLKLSDSYMHLSIYPEERFLKIPRTQKLETTASK
jgi:hypothetical protein